MQQIDISYSNDILTHALFKLKDSRRKDDLMKSMSRVFAASVFLMMFGFFWLLGQMIAADISEGISIFSFVLDIFLRVVVLCIFLYILWWIEPARQVAMISAALGAITGCILGSLFPEFLGGDVWIVTLFMAVALVFGGMQITINRRNKRLKEEQQKKDEIQK